MTTGVMPAAFEDVEEPLKIGVDISVRLIDRMPDAGLSGQMDHSRKTMFCEQLGHRRPMSKIDLHEGKTRIAAQNVETRALQGGIVVAVDVVQSDDPASLVEQPTGDMKTDEASSSGHQNVVGNFF